MLYSLHYIVKFKEIYAGGIKGYFKSFPQPWIHMIDIFVWVRFLAYYLRKKYKVLNAGKSLSNFKLVCAIFNEYWWDIKGSDHKNERGYRLNAIKKRFLSLLILLLSVASIRRKLLKKSHTEEGSAHTNWENFNIQLGP